MALTANTTLPANIIAEQISTEEGKVHLSKNLDVIQLSTENEVEKHFDNSSSGTMFFSEAIPPGYAIGTLTSGTIRYFSNLISASSVGSILSINSVPSVGGMFYGPGDTMYITTGAGDAIVRVLTVNPSMGGQVLTVELVSSGTSGYSVSTQNDTNKITGSGIGCKIDITAISMGNLSTIAISSIYEHVRGYVCRDFSDNADASWNNYLSSTAGQLGLIRRKTDGSGLTGIRVIMFNRSDYGDRIKPGSFNATVNTSVSAYKYGENLDNSKNYPSLTDKTASDSGFWMGMTSNPGLIGSTQNGVSGSVLTGFSIYLRVRPELTPCPIQTLLSRKSGDYSQSAFGNAIVDKQYMSLDPLSANALVSSPYIFNASTNTYECTMNVAVNYRIAEVINTNLFITGTIQVGDIYVLNGGDGTASVRITQVTNTFPKTIQFEIWNKGVAGYIENYAYSTIAPAGRAAISVFVSKVEAVPISTQSTTGASSAVITFYNVKHGVMRWGVSAQDIYPAGVGTAGKLKFTTAQAQAITNSGFATLTGWYTAAGSAYSSSYVGSTSQVVSYSSTAIAEDLVGNRLIISGITSGASSDYIFQKLVLSSGLSGLIVSFDLTTTGDNMYTGQKLKTLIQKDAGPSAHTSSICSFTDSYLIGFSRWPYKTTIEKHVDLLYDAPAYEFTPTAVWIGFSIDSSAATAYDREFHIQNVKVSAVPSTLYDGQSASITAWFDAVPSDLSTHYLTFYARKKNLEIFPNKKIYLKLKQQFI